MKKILREEMAARLRTLSLYFITVLKWLSLSLVTGVSCGLVGSLFHIGVNAATKCRQRHPVFLLLLPLAGLLIVGIYRITRTEGMGTNDVVDAVSLGHRLPLRLLPSIFLSTVLTHLGGGSAGREGAALQMGGAIGNFVGKSFRLDSRDVRTATLMGMSAFFSALFGTPLAASVFAIMVISVGVLYHAAFIPCFISSLISYGVSLVMGIEPTRFSVAMPEVGPAMFFKIVPLAILCAFVSVLFCKAIHFAEKGAAKLIKNPWLRCAAGGVLIICMTLLVGRGDYNGAGMDIVADAIERGSAEPFAFALKILFTAVTLAAGFKGGEVVPAFFVGSVFGCVVGPYFGIPAGFAAALGLVCVFCGAVNCPVAATFLALELFGGGGLLYFALACGISYVFSGYSGLYSSQTILYSKIKAQYINIHTNSVRSGEPALYTGAEEKPLPGVKQAGGQNS